MRHRVILLCLYLLPSLISAHTFYVTNTKDDGSEGSFRWAVEMCNWYPLIPDTVLFAIPLDDPGYNPEFGFWTIRCDTNLTGAHTRYKISQPGAYIDAFSQREFIGYDTNPLGPEIELIGPSTLVECFAIQKSDVTIRGFCINHYGGITIQLNPWPPGEIDILENIRISGCYVGMDPTGTINHEVAWYGLDLNKGRNIIIGGDGPDDRNVFGWIQFSCITVDRSEDVYVINNYIGVDPTGTVDFSAPIPNYGIFIYQNTGFIEIRNNLICGYWTNGMDIDSCSREAGLVWIHNNIIGESLDGSAMGPKTDGIDIIYSSGTLIEENLIAHVTGWWGIEVSPDPSDSVTISRNSIYQIHRLGIFLDGGPNTGSGMNIIDGQYGPGPNEEIDPCICDSVVTSRVGPGGTTTAYFTCMADCTVEVFIGDGDGYHPWCPLYEYGDAYSGKTYLGDAEEIVMGPVFSQYRYSISPALPPGTILTTTATNRSGSTSEFGCSCTIPLLGETETGCLPSEFRLFPPAPNPTFGEITLCYHIPETSKVYVAVYDMSGREVAVLTDDELPPSIYGIRWDGANNQGTPVPSGSYVIRMEAKEYVQSYPLNIIR